MLRKQFGEPSVRNRDDTENVFKRFLCKYRFKIVP